MAPAPLLIALAAPSRVAGPTYERDIFPILKQFCGPCHGASGGESGISLLALKTSADLKTHRETWERVIRQISSGKMPPTGMPAPSATQREMVVQFLGAAMRGGSAPARSTMRRLNRAEYNNTVRDLLGVSLRPADDFPSDEVGDGFDNIGSVLSLSPLLMERYLGAAREVAQAAIYTDGSKAIRADATSSEAGNSNPLPDGGRLLYSNGEVEATFTAPVAGTYKLTVAAFQDKAGPENAKMALSANGKPLDTFEVADARGRPGIYALNFEAPAGRVRVAASFINDFYQKDGPPGANDRNLGVLYFELTGPLGAVAGPSAAQKRIIFTRPTSGDWGIAERQVLSAFAARAYRRPPTRDQVERLVGVAELAHHNGESFEKGIQLAIEAALCSPNFLFRPEPGPDLDDYALASRLSYFLWSSMPDDALFALAAKGKLRDPAVLVAQAKRMLADPKAAALAENFAGQWLQTRKLASMAPDRARFPEFNDELRQSMATETRLFFQNVVAQDRPILDFLDARYSFVDSRLADLYGIGGVTGKAFRKVELPKGRAGVITQASVLTVTSNPTRTSPVKRGKWILDNILGEPPPPPPPGVSDLKGEGALSSASLRERLEAHRKDALCASCHVQMDGLGFALENYDAVGAWRAKDGVFAIDARGTLPDGAKFEGPIELRDVLLARKGKFVRCLAEKLTTYAIGRGVDERDRATMDGIVRSVGANGYRFSSLVAAIVRSDAFRKQAVEK